MLLSAADIGAACANCSWLAFRHKGHIDQRAAPKALQEAVAKSDCTFLCCNRHCPVFPSLRYRSCRTLKTRKTCWCKWSDIRFACCASPAVIPSASQASTVNRDERATLMLNIQATTSLPVAADHSPLSSPLSSKLKKKVAKAAWKTRKAQC